MQPFLIDTHAHIYLPEFEAERAAVMGKASAEGIKHILLPAIDSSTHEAMMQTAEAFPGCRAMMGLHPCSVKEDVEKELAIVETHLKQKNFIAIGEIGLDFYWDKTFTSQQYHAFHHQIELALQYNMPVVIHSRNATDECIAAVKQYKGLRGVFHCFSGTTEQANQLIEIDFMLGIGGVLTYKNSGLDAVVKAIGLSHLVLETDAPYLAPVPFRGKRNQPLYIKYVAEKLATILEVDSGEVASITTSNAKKLFGMTDNH